MFLSILDQLGEIVDTSIGVWVLEEHPSNIISTEVHLAVWHNPDFNIDWTTEKERRKERTVHK